MKVYLDTNVFYSAYLPVEYSDIAEWILTQLEGKVQAVTSEWTIAEMFRALKKQVNLDVIDNELANIALDFFISEIKQYSYDRHLILSPINLKSIFLTRSKIFNENLYASDALHAVTAENENTKVFISFDSDFSKYIDIPVLNPSAPNFIDRFEELVDQYQD